MLEYKIIDSLRWSMILKRCFMQPCHYGCNLDRNLKVLKFMKRELRIKFLRENIIVDKYDMNNAYGRSDNAILPRFFFAPVDRDRKEVILT